MGSHVSEVKYKGNLSATIAGFLSTDKPRFPKKRGSPDLRSEAQGGAGTPHTLPDSIHQIAKVAARVMVMKTQSIADAVDVKAKDKPVKTQHLKVTFKLITVARCVIVELESFKVTHQPKSTTTSTTTIMEYDSIEHATRAGAHISRALPDSCVQVVGTTVMVTTTSATQYHQSNFPYIDIAVSDVGKPVKLSQPSTKPVIAKSSSCFNAPVIITPAVASTYLDRLSVTFSPVPMQPTYTDLGFGVGLAKGSTEPFPAINAKRNGIVIPEELDHCMACCNDDICHFIRRRWKQRAVDSDAPEVVISCVGLATCLGRKKAGKLVTNPKLYSAKTM